MKILKIMLLALIVLLVSCETSERDNGKLTGRILYEETSDQVDGAKVFLRNIISADSFRFCDTVYTTNIGYYKFYDVQAGEYDVHAVKYLSEDETTVTHVTPFSDPIVFNDEVVTPAVEDMGAFEIKTFGSVKGYVYFNNEPESDVYVCLYKIEAGETVIIEQDVTNVIGEYNFDSVITGNYYVYVEYYHTIFDIITEKSDIFFNDGTESLTVNFDLVEN